MQAQACTLCVLSVPFATVAQSVDTAGWISERASASYESEESFASAERAAAGASLRRRWSLGRSDGTPAATTSHGDWAVDALDARRTGGARHVGDRPKGAESTSGNSDAAPASSRHASGAYDRLGSRDPLGYAHGQGHGGGGGDARGVGGGVRPSLLSSAVVADGRGVGGGRSGDLRHVSAASSDGDLDFLSVSSVVGSGQRWVGSGRSSRSDSLASLGSLVEGTDFAKHYRR